METQFVCNALAYQQAVVHTVKIMQVSHKHVALHVKHLILLVDIYAGDIAIDLYTATSVDHIGSDLGSYICDLLIALYFFYDAIGIGETLGLYELFWIGKYFNGWIREVTGEHVCICNLILAVQAYMGRTVERHFFEIVVSAFHQRLHENEHGYAEHNAE